jgi:hypothetical protein
MLTLFLGGLIAPSQASAQSRFPLSVQGSVLSTLVTADGTSAPGVGGEVQLRVNALGMQRGPGVLSVGGGGQYTAHVFSDGTLTVSGAFLEPRLAWGTSRANWFRYAALRGAVLRQSSPAATSSRGYAVGAGGGLIHTLGFRHNFDVGAAVLYQQFDDAVTPSGRSFRFRGALSFALKVGLTVGFGGV